MNINNFLHTSFGKSLIVFSIGLSLGLPSESSVSAKTKVIEEQTAKTQTNNVFVVEGKTTPISFKNDEVITFIVLSDQSRNVYNTNAPVESGQAKSIFLRQIQSLEIPGTTTTSNPNLIVVTTNAQGQQSEYEFIINNSSEEEDRYNIAIEPTKPKPKPKIVALPKDTIETSLGQATPMHVEIGLNTSLKRGQLRPDDELVFAVKEYIALTQNGTSATKAIESTEVPLSVVQALGKTGQMEDTRRRLMPLSPRLPLSNEQKQIGDRPN